MLRRTLIVIAAAGPAMLPAASLAYDIKQKTPETAFSKKLHPDILGVSAGTPRQNPHVRFSNRRSGAAATPRRISSSRNSGAQPQAIPRR